jgi:hypothetical protein
VLGLDQLRRPVLGVGLGVGVDPLADLEHVELDPSSTPRFEKHRIIMRLQGA